MKKINIFILLTTISNSLSLIFLPFILLNNNYNLKEIIFFFILVYFYSIINLLLLRYFNSIKIKYFYTFTFLIFLILLYKINNYIIYFLTSYFYSLYMSLYFTIKNILSIKNIKKQRNNSKIYIIFTLFGVILGTIFYYLNIFNNKYLIILFNFIIMLISLLLIINKYNYSYNKVHKIRINTIIFLFFEQFKYIIITFSSLYIYINLNSKIKYIVIINILSYLSSIFVLLSKKEKRYNYNIIVILISILFIIKFNINNKNILLIIIFFEGILRYLLENISMNKIYIESNLNTIVDYSTIIELIKNIFRFIILFTFYLFNINLYYILILSSICFLLSIIIKYDNT
jgi:hypothetical protein